MRMETILKELKHFLNEELKLTAFPAKYKKQLIAFYYLASKIEPQKRYAEKEINRLLNEWALFGDHATLRRELYNKHLLNRTDDCAYYWKEENLPNLESFLNAYL